MSFAENPFCRLLYRRRQTIHVKMQWCVYKPIWHYQIVFNVFCTTLKFSNTANITNQQTAYTANNVYIIIVIR